MKKKIVDLKEGDVIYHISMGDSELNEKNGTCMQELTVENIVKSFSINSTSVRASGNTFFTTDPENSVYIKRIDYQDEIDLSFEIYATTKEEAVEEAQKLVLGRLRTLDLIKKRINESETGLMIAEASLNFVDTTEEQSLEEFASMALG